MSLFGSLRIHFPFLRNLTVDGAGTKYYATPYAYETEVTNVLKTLKATRTGRALFEEIEANTSHKITIKPWEGANLDATSNAASEKNAIPVGSSEGSGMNRINGVGGGSDVTVSYTPGRFAAYCQAEILKQVMSRYNHFPFKTIRRPLAISGEWPDDVLCHEMLHCVRLMYGLWNPVPLGDGYDNEEEFLAIMLANIYTSEKGNSADLRRNHQTNFHLTQDTDATFLPKADQTDYRFRIIGRFIGAQSRLAQKLSIIPAAFNPVRRHMQLQGRAFTFPFSRSRFPMTGV